MLIVNKEKKIFPIKEIQLNSKMVQEFYKLSYTHVEKEESFIQ